MRANTQPADDFEWIIYARISDDREGAGLGVARQDKDCRALAERLPGRVLAEVCVDNDLTAYDRSSRHKKRPGYERLIELLRERPGRRGALVWHTDRLHRTPRELEDLIDVIDELDAPVQTVKAGPVDLRTPSGRAVARTLCAWARYESEHKSERIKAKIGELVDAGKLHNGGPRPFGYARTYAGGPPHRKIVREEVDPIEAGVIRECARRVLAREPLRSVVRELNERGIRTSQGNRWNSTGLRGVLVSGRIAGLKEHRGAIVGEAVWPAIITRETHEQLRALLGASRIANERPLGQARRHYLSGFVWCTCGTRRPMKVARVGGKLKYSCHPKTEGGCGGRLINLPELEGMVALYVIGRLSDPATLYELAARESAGNERAQELTAAIERDEGKLSALESELTDGDAEDVPEIVSVVRAVRRRIADARAALARCAGAPVLADVDPSTLSQHWDHLDLDRRRALLALVVERIEIAPARVGLNRFDPRRVRLVPR